jgi:DNA mismatch repair protein MutS
MTIIDDYLDEQIKYEKKYGKYTIVLMQVGHFYEAYGVDNEKENTNRENMARLADIMNIQMTRKNKSISENNRGNPLMIGVNIYSIDKYIQILLNANYTIVLISQTSDPPYVKREVTNIYSPGTNIEYSIKGNTNNLVSVYLEQIKQHDGNEILFIGASTVDLSIGKNTVFEIHSMLNDKNYALDELFRFIQVYDPKELIVIKKNFNMSNDKISNYLELNNRIVHHKSIDDIKSNYFTINYQKQFLERIFKNHGLLSVIEYLDLETKHFGLISYIFLLDFAYEHNPKFIEKIDKPEIWDNEKYLILANNTINQLNLVDHHTQNITSKYSSLFAVINSTSTNIGKRYLRDNLLNPIIDSKRLQNRYNIIESLTNLGDFNEPLYKTYEGCLTKITDIEKLHRKLSLNLLQPAHFSSLDISYENIFKILEIENDVVNQLKPSEEDLGKFREFIDEYRSHFDLSEIVKYHLDKISNSFFKRNVCEKIDNMQNNIEKSKNIFNLIIDELSKYVDEKSKGKALIKLDYTERDGYYLVLTSKRAKSLKDNLDKKKIKIKLYDEILDTKCLTFKNHAKSICKIECDYLKNLSRTLVKSNDKIHDLCRSKFLQLCEVYENKYGNYLKSITRFIGEIDMFKSIAKVSCKYGYTKPIIDESSEKSYIDFEEIRHPIIERINNDINYVTNDIKLGEDKYGLLLFGTNASGKSSLMKAVGLNVIMAQSGFFVSSKRFKFKPFKNIFTRINNNDNIFKGESSFAVEMSELRSILKRTCSNSIVLGDELCSGTESISALSIFSSSVVKLNEKKTTFIFATHLHELCKIKQVTNLDTIRFAHLKVVFDEETGELIYDRKLQDGNGHAIYGLEVCKAMDMDSDFLKLSESIRKNLLGEKQQILEQKQSKYNTDVYIHNCLVCNADAEDVHHIKFQSCANENKIIDAFLTKDAKSNLVPLCKKCHNEVHNGNLEIHGYKQTSSGIKLDFNYLEKEQYDVKKLKKKKYDNQQISTIRNVYSSNKSSKKEMCLFLEKNHNIKISVSTFNKIINNEY